MDYVMYHDSYLALCLNIIKSPKALFAILTVSAAWWLLRPNKKPKRNIQDEVVMIIGASSGVGLETARLYAKSWETHPNRVIHLIARRTEIRDIRKEIARSTGCKHVVAHVVNAASEDSMRQLAEIMQILTGSGRIDTLIYCVGALTTRGFVELGRDSVTESSQGGASRTTAADSELHKGDSLLSVAKASYEANVLSCMNTINVLLPLLQQSSRPRIAVLSSVAAEIPAPTRSIYAAHKAALSMFLRCLRIELDSLPVGKASGSQYRGVGISIIHPASIRTGLREKSLDIREQISDQTSSIAGAQQHEKSAMSAEYVAEQVKKAIDYEIDEMWLPSLYWWVAKVGMVVAPDFIARKAKKKYNWSV